MLLLIENAHDLTLQTEILGRQPVSSDSWKKRPAGRVKVAKTPIEIWNMRLELIRDFYRGAQTNNIPSMLREENEEEQEEEEGGRERRRAAMLPYY